MGIRGFLVDTHYGRLRDDGTVVTDDDGRHRANGPLGTYFCHEYCQLGASKLAPSLRQYRKFLRNHPHNVLLIDNEDYVSPSDFAAAMRRSRLLDFVYEGPTDDATSQNWCSATVPTVSTRTRRRSGRSPSASLGERRHEQPSAPMPKATANRTT